VKVDNCEWNNASLYRWRLLHKSSNLIEYENFLTDGPQFFYNFTLYGILARSLVSMIMGDNRVVMIINCPHLWRIFKIFLSPTAITIITIFVKKGDCCNFTTTWTHKTTPFSKKKSVVGNLYTKDSRKQYQSKVFF